MTHLTVGRTWKFGDNINTDLMLPAPAVTLPAEEQVKWIFHANRPDWIKQVQKGDIIVGGRNYGMGSGRPAARSLGNAGVGALLAESMNSLFFRNAVNYGFLALECPGVTEAFEEGQTAEIDTDTWTVRNRETGVTLQVKPVHPELFALMTHGGVIPSLVKDGSIRFRAEPNIPRGAVPSA